MTGEWRDCTLADACSAIDYGLTASASDQLGGPKFLRITDIVNGQIDWHSVPHVAADDATTAKYRLNDGDVVLARTGASTGASAYVKNPPPAVFASYLVRLQAKPEFESRFLAYYLKSDRFWNYIRGVLGEKSAQPNASASTMTKAPLRAPQDKAEQRAIAQILGTLDDKIVLNRRMNETLEAMARGLFKSWFLDFDPVRAKVAGLNTSLPKNVSALFPESLVESGLGETPKGWRVGRLGDVLSVLETGGRPKGGVKEIATGVPSVGAESIVGIGRFEFSKTKYVPQAFFDAMKRGHVRDLDVLLYKDGGRPGEFEPHVTIVGEGFPFRTFCINEHVYRLRAEPALPQSFLFFWLSSDACMEEMRVRGTGVAIPGLNSTAVRELAVLIPDPKVLEAFNSIVEGLIRRILEGCNESRAIAAIRDALLPKLISGELRLQQVGRILERAV